MLIIILLLITAIVFWGSIYFKTKPGYLLFAFFWLVLFWLGPGFSSGLNLGSFQVNVMDIVLICGLISCLIPVLLNKRAFINSSKYAIIFTIIVLQGFIVGLFVNSALKIATDMRPFVYFIALWIWVLLLTRLVSKTMLINLIVWVFALGAIGALIKVLLIIAGVIPGTGPLEMTQVMTLQSSELGGARINLLGVDSFSTITLPLLFSIIILDKQYGKSLIIRLGLISIIIVEILGFTRSAWLGSAIGIMLILILYRISPVPSLHKIRFRYLLLVAGALLVFLNMKANIYEFNFMTLIEHRLSGDYDLGGGIGGLTDYRVEEAKALLESYMSDPLLGKGFGGSYWFKTLTSPASDFMIWSHCGYLWLLLKVGIVGLLLFMIALIGSIKRALSLLYRVKIDIAEWPFYAGLLGGFVGFCLMNITNNRFAQQEGGVILGLWFALLGGMKVRKKMTSRDRPQLLGPRIPVKQPSFTGTSAAIQ